MFLNQCSEIRPNSTLALRPVPARQSYEVIATYVAVVIQHQGPSKIRDSIEFLSKLFSGEVDYVQEQPFALVTACLYLDAIIERGLLEDEHTQLRRLICSFCAITVDRISDEEGWAALDEAVDHIFRHHTGNQVRSSMLTNHLIT
jgi:hypothetical protein